MVDRSSNKKNMKTNTRVKFGLKEWQFVGGLEFLATTTILPFMNPVFEL